LRPTQHSRFVAIAMAKRLLCWKRYVKLQAIIRKEFIWKKEPLPPFFVEKDI